MDSSEPDVAARGRALFEQLRAERAGDSAAPDGVADHGGGAVGHPESGATTGKIQAVTAPAAVASTGEPSVAIDDDALVSTATTDDGGPVPPVAVGDGALVPPVAADDGALVPPVAADDGAAAPSVVIYDGAPVPSVAAGDGATDRGAADLRAADESVAADRCAAVPSQSDEVSSGNPIDGAGDPGPLAPSPPFHVEHPTDAGMGTGQPDRVDQADGADHDPEVAAAPDTAGSPTTAGHAEAVAAGTTQTPSAPGPDAGVVAPAARSPHPAAALALPRIVAIANQKGGVGKTTTAVNLGAALAELGFRTLVVDLDPQGNATTGLGINARNLDSSIYDVLMHEMPIDECIEPTSVRNLFVAPATIDLAGAEIELVPAFSRELRLKRALAEVADAYDFTIIDCPPSLGLLTVNGLAAATEVIVPIQCEYYALEGLSQLMRNVNLVQSNLNPALLLSAIILTMYDARTKLADQVATEVREHFGARVCRHVVPRTVRLSEAPSFGQPIIVFDPSSRGALAYRELAKEVSGGAPQRVG